MNHEMLEDIFEAMLKAAVYENSVREAAVFLTEPLLDVPAASAQKALRNMNLY